MNLDHLPSACFRVIMADPPWKMSRGTKSRPQHYPRMTIAEIKAMDVQRIAEFMIIGKLGKPQSIKGNPWTGVVLSPRREHSRKPDEIRSEIAERLGGPRLELFARSSAPGWQSAGNETTKFDEVAA